MMGGHWVQVVYGWRWDFSPPEIIQPDTSLYIVNGIININPKHNPKPNAKSNHSPSMAP